MTKFKKDYDLLDDHKSKIVEGLVKGYYKDLEELLLTVLSSGVTLDMLRVSSPKMVMSSTPISNIVSLESQISWSN
jgi:hypothetical protein